MDSILQLWSQKSLEPHHRLQKAEASDSYLAHVAASPMNVMARRQCSYTAWPNQTHPYNNSNIIIMNPSAEGGMPHTRPGNIICIPAYYPESQIAETLEHETIHIDQRNNFGAWKGKANEEGWYQVRDAIIPSVLRNRCRLNPDTFWARFWAYDGRYVPLPYFIREDKPQLREVVIRWYDMSEDIIRSVVPTVFTEKYGSLSTSSMEHPFELWAYHSDK